MKKNTLLFVFVLLAAITQAQPWRDSTITSGVTDGRPDSLPLSFSIYPPTTWLLHQRNYSTGGQKMPMPTDIITVCDTNFRSAILYTELEPSEYRKFSIFVSSSGLAPEDSIRVALLSNQIAALMERDTNEFILLSVLCSHIAEPDFYEYRFLGGFPITLDLHIERKSPYAIAAGNLKRRCFPEKD